MSPFKDRDKRLEYHKEYSSKWYAENKEKILAKEKQRRESDPEYCERSNERSRQHYLRNKAKYAARKPGARSEASKANLNSIPSAVRARKFGKDLTWTE